MALSDAKNSLAASIECWRKSVARTGPALPTSKDGYYWYLERVDVKKRNIVLLLLALSRLIRLSLLLWYGAMTGNGRYTGSLRN